jgi:hypothetical protein
LVSRFTPVPSSDTLPVTMSRRRTVAASPAIAPTIATRSTWAGSNWLKIQTYDNESAADFARFYIDQIDMWDTGS